MSKITYLTKNLGAVTLQRIHQANTIIEEFQAKGFKMTVRQVYYQFVARGLIANELRSYKLVANALEKGRMGGLIDWYAIEDRTRFLRGNTHWGSPSEILSSAAAGYRLDSRADQPYLIEVWIEKDALVGVIEPICEELDIDYFACKGYVSLSEMWRAAGRYNYDGRPCKLLYLGDHDPSGLDMTRCVGDILHTFGCENIEVFRIALNMDQVEEHQPPPNFAKLSDTRSADYIATYGEESWELDALPPDVITEVIEENVDLLTDDRKRRKLLALQEAHREKLEDIALHWEEI